MNNTPSMRARPCLMYVLRPLLLWLLISSWAYGMTCNENVPPPADSKPLRVLALEYPAGISFSDWLQRTDSQVTCRLFERLGISHEFFMMPYRRAIAEMAADNADLMVGSIIFLSQRFSVTCR
ncbi:MAG: hypothetical protein R3E95_07630 [Thiolinea sp.]